jgi:hypothetical protein
MRPLYRTDVVSDRDGWRLSSDALPVRSGSTRDCAGDHGIGHRRQDRLDTYGHLFDGLDEGAADVLDAVFSEAAVPDVCHSDDLGVVELSG